METIKLCFSVGGVLGGLGVLAFQVLFWIKAGYWLELSIAHTLDWLGASWVHVGALDALSGWVGAQRIVAWLFAFPTSAALFVTGLLVILYGPDIDHDA